MAGKKLLIKDFQEKSAVLSADRQKKVKGGYREVPSGAGSFGMVNWGEIDIRFGKSRDEFEALTPVYNRRP
jgi:hypothetical protein